MFRTRYILGAVISFVMFAMIVGCTQGTTDEAEKSTPQDVAVVTEETDVNEVTEALIAKFNNVKGDVQIVREDETITVEEAMEVPLQLGDRIVTGDDAGVNIYFNDETSVYVQDNGEMEFLYWERDTEKDSVVLRHIAGVLLHVVRTGDQYIVLWDNDFIQAKGTVFITSIMNSNHSLHQLTGQSQYFAYNGPPSSDFYDESYFSDVLEEIWLAITSGQSFSLDDYSTFGNIDPLHTVHRSPTPGFDVQDYWHYKSEPIPVINFITGLTPELLRLMFEASAEEMEKKAIHLKIWGHIVGQALEQNKLTEEEINDIVVNNFNNLLEVITVLNEEELKELEGYASFYEAIKQIQDMMEQFNAKQLAKYEDESDLNNVDMENWLKQQRERKQAVAQNISEQNAKTIHIQKLVNRHLEHLTKEQEEEQHKGIEEEIKPIQLQRFPDHELEVTQMLEIPIVVYPRDVKLQVQSSNPEIATVKVEQQKLLVEALREGTVIIQIFAYKNGYQSTQSNFKVTVNASQGLPLAKNIYIPQDGFMRFANGVVLDVAGNTIGPLAQVNVREVTANVPATLQQAGKIVNITFENFTLTKPARLILPYQQAIDFDRIGVFHEESQGSWRFVPFTKTAQGLQVETSNFSTFGVFTAPKLNIPYASISGEVPKGTTIYLDANEFAQIFYSIDGSIPTEQSNLFTRRNPIVVDQAMTLKARAFANNYLPSDVAIYVYVLPIEFSVTFQVTDGTNPIAGATVKINDEIVMTDSTGVASFALPNGTYMYYIEKAGFQPLNGIYFTVEETDMTIPIVLQADEN